MLRTSGIIFLLLFATATVSAQFTHEKTYDIESVTVTSDGEDRAYRIMRNAIARAPYYAHQVSEYSAEVYLKGSLDVVKITRLMRNVTGNELNGYRDGETYVQESWNEVDFIAPDKFEQRVVKQLSSMPGGGGGNDDRTQQQAMMLVNINIYDPGALPLIISPLSPGAFSHYNFRYEGYVEDRGRIVNKIRVIPQRRSQQLVSGHIFIAEDEWNVRGLDLSGHMNLVAGIDFNLQTDYGEVSKNTWMPTRHRITFDMRLAGSSLAMRYTASVDYGRIVSGNGISLAAGNAVADMATETSGDKLTNRDAYRTARQVARVIEAPGRRSLDITREFVDNFKVTVDTLAALPDPEFWDRVRPIALEPSELKGYRDHEIIATTKPQPLPDTTIIRRKRRKTIAAKVLFGRSPVALGERGGEIIWRGVIPTKSGFNTVDGFYLGIWPVDYRKTFGPSAETTLTVSPQFGWAINRHVLLADMVAHLEYAPVRRGEFSIRVGSVSRDFSSNPDEGILPFDNTVSSLVYRRNRLKLYGDNFVEASNSIDITNGLSLSVSAKYARREGLENTSDYSLFYRKSRFYTRNISIPDHTAAILTANVEFTPRQYYRIRENGRKDMVRSDWPTFFVSWKKGVKGVAGSTTQFDHISGGVRQDIELGHPLHRLEYFVYGGFFASSKNLFFPDFRHFDATDIPFTNSSITSVGSFRMIPTYRYSTPERYLEVHVSYQARFLLIKLLPWFSGRLWQEGMQIHYLDTPGLRNHLEVNYTVGLIWRAGVFVGFENFKYSRIGFKFSIPIRFGMNGVSVSL